MPDLSKIKIRPRPQRYGYKLIAPPQYHSEFLALVNKLVPYYKDLIDDMIQSAGGVIAYPMETDLMVKYLDGYTIKYCEFYDDNFQNGELQARCSTIS